MSLTRGIVFAIVMLMVAAGMRSVTTTWLPLSGDWSQRVTMALMGVVLIVMGNAIPKTLTPLAALTCDASELQQLQRLSGWMWVSAGAALSLEWLVLPANIAQSLTFVIVGGTAMTVIVQMMRLHRRRASR